MIQEKVMHTKICSKCNKSFDITNKDLEYYDLICPIINNKKIKIPISDICHCCMEQDRLSWRNERNLYKSQCHLSGKNIISMFHEKSPYVVYDYNLWESDIWNPLDFGINYNMEKTFFEQFEILLKKIPHKNLFIASSQNSLYNNSINDCNNAYMCFDNSNLNNCLYCEYSGFINDSIDVSWSYKVDNSYEILDSSNIYKSYFCSISNNLVNSYFCTNCNDCSDCFLCSGIQNKKYFLLNKKYSKIDYEKKVQEILANKNYINDCKILLNKLNLSLPNKALLSSGNQNCLGSNVYDSNNSYNFFNYVEGNNIRHSSDGGRISNVFDSNNIYDGEGIIYNSLTSSGSYKIINSMFIFDSSDIFYSYSLLNCTNCFGCVGLKYKSYCIFNKQYTKNEYEILVLHIINSMQNSGDWGKFFPVSISPFGYNETKAQEFYPLFKDEAIQLGYNWSNYIKALPIASKIIEAGSLPNSICDIPNDILNRAIECEESRKLYKITIQELEFYRKHNLAIAKKHPDIRYLNRMALRNPRKIFDRLCDKCGKNIKSTYQVNKKNIVYCSECYDSEFY